MAAPAAEQTRPRPYLGPRFNWLNPILILAGIAVVGWSVNGTGFSLTGPFEANNVKSVSRFVGGLFPPDLSPDFLRHVVQLTIEATQFSILCTVLAILFGFPLAVIALRQRGEDVSRSSLGTTHWLVRWTTYYASRTV